MYTVERLLRVSRGQEAANSTLDRPLDHLVACHGRIEDQLGVLERAAAALNAAPQEALEAVDACFRYFESNGMLHTADEEESVFPRMRDRVTEAEAAELRMLEDQHREADAIYAELKSLAAHLRAHPQDAAATGEFRERTARFSKLYRDHIAFENRELVAVARRVLGADELQSISAEMRRRRKF